jgi:hypothetical protein
MFKRILIATDGSELAQKAVTHGLALARALDATVTAITVTDIYPTGPYSPVPLPSMIALRGGGGTGGGQYIGGGERCCDEAWYFLRYDACKGPAAGARYLGRGQAEWVRFNSHRFSRSTWDGTASARESGSEGRDVKCAAGPYLPLN